MVSTTAHHTPLVTIKPGDSDAGATPDMKVMALHVPQPIHAIPIHVHRVQHVLPVLTAGTPVRVPLVTAVAGRDTVVAAMLMNAILVITTVPLALHVLTATVAIAVPVKMGIPETDTAANKMTLMSAIWVHTTVHPMQSVPIPRLVLIVHVQMAGVVME